MTAEASSCATVGTTWWNQGFASQTGWFHTEFAVTPERANVDAVIGLSKGSASQWANLAAIVRFNQQGTIDARAGSAYRADTTLAYQAGTTYYVRLDVDITAHTYSVRVGNQPGVYLWQIATAYPFRTEQASVTSLDHVAGYVSPTVGGAVDVCGFVALTDGAPGDGCLTTQSGGGFRNYSIGASTTIITLSLDARPSAANIDGVVGVANGPVDAFGDFAASMRFATTGYLEARDGDTYRADAAVPYAAGQTYSLQFVIDLPSKTYSVFVRNYPEYASDTEIARGYHFRSQQATVPRLDDVAAIVDSASGNLATCNVLARTRAGVVSARDGTFDVQPLADGSALISDGAQTQRIDANGVPLGGVAIGGVVTADPQGNVYIASVGSGALTVHAYTAAWEPRWTQSYPVDDAEVGDIVVTTTFGNIAVTLGTSSGDAFIPGHIAWIDPSGGLRARSQLPAGITAIGLSANHFVTAEPVTNGRIIYVWSYGDPPQRLIGRAMTGNYTVDQVSIATDDMIVFGGHLNAPMDFGNCAIAPFSNSEVYWSAYITVMRADIGTQFCRRLTTDVTGLASDTSRIAVAYHTRTQLPYVDTVVYDRAGNTLASTTEDAFVGWFGRPGRIALAPSGQLYLDEFASFQSPSEQRFPFLVTLSP